MIKQEFIAPSRTGLILSGVLVALHGFENEAIARARAFGDGNWNEHPDVLEARRIASAIRIGEPVEIEHERIRDLLAHTQQIMRVSHDEWEAVVSMITFPLEDAETKPKGTFCPR